MAQIRILLKGLGFRVGLAVWDLWSLGLRALQLGVGY